MGYFKTVKPRYDFKAWAAHHFYTGFIISLVGFIGIFQLWFPDWLSLVLLTLGLWILIDDAIQHIIQREEVTKQGYYTTVSFWHWFPYWVIGVKVE